jgi:hypothetical protein
MGSPALGNAGAVRRSGMRADAAGHCGTRFMVAGCSAASLTRPAASLPFEAERDTKHDDRTPVSAAQQVGCGVRHARTTKAARTVCAPFRNDPDRCAKVRDRGPGEPELSASAPPGGRLTNGSVPIHVPPCTT